MVLDLPSSRAEAWRWADLGALSAAAALAPMPTAAIATASTSPARACCSSTACSTTASTLARSRSPRSRERPCARPTRARPRLDAAPRRGRRGRPDPDRPCRHRRREPSARRDRRSPRTRSRPVVETYVGAGWANRADPHRARPRRAAACARCGCSRTRASSRSATRRASAQGASLVSIFLGAGAAGSADRRRDQPRRRGRLCRAGRRAAHARRAAAGMRRRACAHAPAQRPVARSGARSRRTRRPPASPRAVEVARDAQKTDGEQSLRGLLLHRTATVNLKPELEIFADDVKCAHGATVGELDAARAVLPGEPRHSARAAPRRC